MFGNRFPYSNFHDINMDWIINTIKTLWSKSVFTVNNTAPDASGNVNLPQVSGMSSVNGIGADGQGNVQIISRPTFIYRDLQSADFTANVDNGAVGLMCWRCGVCSLRFVATIKAGTSVNDEILNIPSTIPVKSGDVVLIGFDATRSMKVFRIDANDKLVTRDAYSEDTEVTLYGTYITYPTVDIPIVAP